MINIVVERNWILERCAKELASRFDFVTVNSEYAHDGSYVMPAAKYMLPRIEKAQGPRIGFFTHAPAEHLDELVPLFSAHVCMNEHMASLLRERGCAPILARPGAHRDPKTITFGVCGSTKKDGRKGEALIHKMVRAGYTVLGHGAGWPCRILTDDVSRLSEFYQKIDYLVVPSSVEGGPMPLVDAIANGVPVIAPSVGWAPEFPCIRYQTGSWESLSAVLKALTQPPSWDGWAEAHKPIFEKFIVERPAAVAGPELPTVALCVRTVDRSPKRNYLKKTVENLARQGCKQALHVYCSDPDVAWIHGAIEGFDAFPINVAAPPPGEKAHPNETGLRAIEMALAAEPDAEWVLVMEDDLEFCKDFVGSVRRWIRRAAKADRNVYRFFGFERPRNGYRRVSAFDHTLESLRASQAVLLRRADARDFVEWARINEDTWRSGRWPKVVSGADPHVAFDKLVGEWSLRKWPGRPGVLSWPFFVNHIGHESSLHRRGVIDARQFGGKDWSYGG